MRVDSELLREEEEREIVILQNENSLLKNKLEFALEELRGCENIFNSEKIKNEKLILQSKRDEREKIILETRIKTLTSKFNMKIDSLKREMKEKEETYDFHRQALEKKIKSQERKLEISLNQRDFLEEMFENIEKFIKTAKRDNSIEFDEIE